MEFKQLEAFIHVAELGSFTKAAAILNTTQPALSRAVRQLELECRHHLLERHGRGVGLTEAGRLLLAHGKAVLHELELARQALDALHGNASGRLSIGLPPSVAATSSVALIKRYKADFPDTTIAITEGLSTYLTEWLLMGRIDVAIMYDTGPSKLLDKRVLWSDDLYLVSAANAGATPPDEVTFSSIGEYPLIMPSRMHVFRTLLEAQALEAGVKLDIALEVDAVSSVLSLVSEGYGHAVLPLNASQGGFHAARIVSPALSSKLVIATSTQRPLSRLATLALDSLADEILRLHGSRT
jgi:LysR family nitrogen assimilation transcriptional regulator